MFENLKILYPKILWSLAVIPLLLIFIWLKAKQYKNTLKTLGNYYVISKLMPEKAPAKKVWKNILLTIAIISLIFALARPQIGIEKAKKQVKGSQIAIVVDISNSMLARPKPSDMSRLEKAKFAIYRLLNKLNNDKISLTVFAGDAALVIPMTVDYEAVKLYISNLNTSFISSQGTAIADALQMAINSFTLDNDENKAIILFSDGEDLQGKADNIAVYAKKNGIKIYTAGVGSVRGNPIYLPNGSTLEYKGQIIVSKLNEQYLKKLAALTNAIYVNITNHPDAIDIIYKDIEKHSTGITTSYSKYQDIYQYFVGLAIIIIIIEFLMLERKNRWIAKLKLFEK